MKTTQERLERLVSSRLRTILTGEFITWLKKNGFFTAPASAAHHGNYEGGLFDHSYAVMQHLDRLTENNGLIWQRPESPFIVGMFHDLCKLDEYRHPDGEPDRWEFVSETLLKGHGDKSVMMLAAHLQLTEEEVLCIRYHMGAFTDREKWSRCTRAVQSFPNVLWTHTADMLAAHVDGI